MPGKKELLSKVLFRTGLFGLANRVRNDLIIIFGWHRIAPDGARPASPWADDVMGPTAAELDRAFAWFAKNTRVISEPQLIDIVHGLTRPRGLSVMFTFDDGYADNFHLVYPLLRKHYLPAVFFVPTRRIEERDLGWVDLIPYAIKTTAKREVAWNGRSFRLPAEREGAIAYLHKVMQLKKHAATKDLVGDLFARLEVKPPPLELQDRELMTWDQLREVASNGISVASHTHTHRVLATLEPDEQREELARSKALLEERLDRPVRTIAYPVGGYDHFTARTRELAREVGYEVGYSYCTGFNRTGSISPFDVKRIGPPLGLELLAGTTVLPEVFDWDTPSAYGGR